MQSGIAASQELVSQFTKLISDHSHFGLLATIKSESIQPLDLLSTSSSGDFSSNLSALTPYIKPNEAFYAILRRYETAPSLIAITYVPDSAPVRQKMLYASTRLSLVRELGSEHFRESIVVTTADELAPKGFDKHDAHSRLEAPLTEEERSLGEVKRAEMEAGTGTGVKEIHLSQTMNMPIAADALAALSEMGRGEGAGLVMLKINPESEVVELVPSRESPGTIADLVSTISATEPRFTFWNFTHTHNEQQSNSVLFFYTCPASAGAKSIKHRMLYPLMKRAVREVAIREAGLRVEKTFEVDEPSEITEASVLSDLHPQAEVKTSFKRPKRPGR